jgi:hypothetical protein
MPGENGHGETDLSQRVMLNAAGRRRGERRDCERENYASMAILFFTAGYLLGMSHQGNLKGVTQSVSPCR